MAQTMDIKGKLKVGPSPHIRSKRTSAWVMTQVMIALIPPTIAATFFFGWYALVQVALGIISSVVFEYLWQKWKYQPIKIHDRSAAVTGMLVGLSFPITVSPIMIIFASFFAIIIVKQLGGGIGKNYFNPAVSARVVSKAFFTPWLANWVLPGGLFGTGYRGVDAIATSTPLEYIGHRAQTVPEQVPELWELFLGTNLGGNIGETSALAISIGMLYLIFRRVIHPKIPILVIITTMLCMGLWSSFDFDFMAAHALSGTLFFAATYMATDYSSGSLTPEGKTVFAIAVGAITAFFRIVFNYPGGIGFAIIIMNFFAPHIDKKLMPRIYGHKARPQADFDRQSDLNG